VRDHELEQRAAERRPTGAQLVDHAAERVDVGPVIDLGRIDTLLRRHVKGRAKHVAALGQARRHGGDELGNAEIEDLDQLAAGLGGDQVDVPRLEVAVDHIGGVGGVQREAELPADVEDERERQASLAVEPRRQALAVQVLHHEVGAAVAAAVLEHGDHAGMRDARRHGRLGEEARHGGGVGDQPLVQELDRDPVAALDVLGGEHRAHATRGQLADQAVVAQHRAFAGGGPGPGRIRLAPHRRRHGGVPQTHIRPRVIVTMAHLHLGPALGQPAGPVSLGTATGRIRRGEFTPAVRTQYWTPTETPERAAKRSSSCSSEPSGSIGIA
jgi:hypothetical protein